MQSQFVCNFAYNYWKKHFLIGRLNNLFIFEKNLKNYRNHEKKDI